VRHVRGTTGVYLDEIILDDSGGRMFACSDTDFCELRRADDHHGTMYGEPAGQALREREP
jgi:alpha-D-ribose 1-methylphosphonate 5-phosphate C-P lyase